MVKKKTETTTPLSDKELKGLSTSIKQNERCSQFDSQTLISLFRKMDTYSTINKEAPHQSDIQRMLGEIGLEVADQLGYLGQIGVIMNIWATRSQILNKIS